MRRRRKDSIPLLKLRCEWCKNLFAWVTSGKTIKAHGIKRTCSPRCQNSLASYEYNRKTATGKEPNQMPHTAGPWFVNGPWHIQAQGKPEDQRPQIVANIVNIGTLQTREANAQLIASAPTMLHNLELIAELAHPLTDSLSDDAKLRRILIFANSAIAQATEPETVFNCKGCGREESICSADPCPGVIADREEEAAEPETAPKTAEQ